MLIAEAVVSHSLMEGNSQIIIQDFEEEKEPQIKSQIIETDSQPQNILTKNEPISKSTQTILTPIFEISQQNSKSHEVSQKFEEPQNFSNNTSNEFEISRNHINEVSNTQNLNLKSSNNFEGGSHQFSQVSKSSEGNLHISQLKNEESPLPPPKSMSI
ncbi:hypothetical protein MK805_07545 [Shimazuella sp. AN120528]|uniref:hypothetical protein n=1 Tax=Shimazuella soli TaxID=1892854 RepID=UPI001F10D939|nr:hypothetical protein [Shimazuella soli]MCH5584826.1 hypothetical protein [Shimazuella soli]